MHRDGIAPSPQANQSVLAACSHQFKENTNPSHRTNRPTHTSASKEPLEQSCTDARAVWLKMALLSIDMFLTFLRDNRRR
jgi:LAS superfamily LD-carboxypeptidase LdcB